MRLPEFSPATRTMIDDLRWDVAGDIWALAQPSVDFWDAARERLDGCEPEHAQAWEEYFDAIWEHYDWNNRGD